MSQIRVEQFGPAAQDGRATLAMCDGQMTADAVIVTSTVTATATGSPLETTTRMLAIRCEDASAKVAVMLVQAASKSAAEALMTSAAKGISLNEGEVRHLGVPVALAGKNNVYVVVMDR